MIELFTYWRVQSWTSKHFSEISDKLRDWVSGPAWMKDILALSVVKWCISKASEHWRRKPSQASVPEKGDGLDYWHKQVKKCLGLWWRCLWIQEWKVHGEEYPQDPWTDCVLPGPWLMLVWPSVMDIPDSETIVREPKQDFIDSKQDGRMQVSIKQMAERQQFLFTRCG